MGWHCGICGEEHEGEPFSFGADYPDPYLQIPQNERDNRAELGDSQCIIDGEKFFVRGCLEIPIIGRDAKFIWGLWVVVWDRDFDWIEETWNKQGREANAPLIPGRIVNELPEYPSVFNLKVKLRTREVGGPLIEPQEDEHPITLEYRRGITVERAFELSALAMHAPHPTSQ